MTESNKYYVNDMYLVYLREQHNHMEEDYKDKRCVRVRRYK